MKIGRTKVLSLLLTFVFVLLMVPALDVFANEETAKSAYDFYNSKDYSAGNEESYIKWDSKEKVLTLKNWSITRNRDGKNELCGIRFHCDATIVLIGTNSIHVENSENDIFGAINMLGNTLTIQGSPEDYYMGSLKLSTAQTYEDNMVIYNARELTVNNVRYLGITAGGSRSASNYGVWRDKKDITVSVINSCIEIKAENAKDYSYAFYPGETGKRTTVNLTNSSYNFKGDDGVFRGKDSFTVNDATFDNTNKYSGTAKPNVIYHNNNDDNDITQSYTEPVPSTGKFAAIGTGVTEPTKNGYTFDGWYMKGADGNLIDPNFDGKTINLLAYEPLNLYAKFTPMKYTITYTDGVEDKEIFKDQVYTKQDYDADTPAFNGTPTREGYTFAGWDPEVEPKVTGDAIYTAKWTQDEYTVTYKDGVNGEAFEEQPYTNKHYGDPTPEFKGKPTRDGYNFKGWNPGVELTVTGNITYTAQWENIPYTIKYTDGVDNEVIFEDQTYPNKYYDDDTPAFDGTPTRTGYTFERWKLQLTTPGDTASIDWNPKVTGDATYVAQWTAIPYTITYTDGVNGTVFADQTATVNYGAATPAFNGTPTREGYTFAGWDPEVEETVIADATYTATWKKNDPQPPVNEPDGTKPDGTTPDGTTPDGTTPDGTTPDGTKPDGTTPDGTTPDGTTPSETKPSETKPSETKPSETKPSETKPSETKPVKSVATGDNAPIVAVTVMVILSGIVLVMMGLRKKHFNN